MIVITSEILGYPKKTGIEIDRLISNLIITLIPHSEWHDALPVYPMVHPSVRIIGTLQNVTCNLCLISIYINSSWYLITMVPWVSISYPWDLNFIMRLKWISNNSSWFKFFYITFFDFSIIWKSSYKYKTINIFELFQIIFLNFLWFSSPIGN